MDFWSWLPVGQQSDVPEFIGSGAGARASLHGGVDPEPTVNTHIARRRQIQRRLLEQYCSCLREFEWR